MTDLIIIYDPEREIAALVNPETQQGWGPAMIGPGADQALQAFIEAAPFDLTLLDSSTATEAFAGFLEGVRAGLAPEAGEAPASPVEPSDGAGMAEGQPPVYGSEDAGEPAAEPGAADPDPEAGTAPAVQVVDCFNCGGTGTIEFGDDVESQTCNMCQGRGRIAQAV